MFLGLSSSQDLLGQMVDYTRSNSFPNLLAPYMPRYVQMPRITSSDSLHQLVQDGKLRLSVEDLIALTLENNLEIAVDRFTIAIAETDILRTKSGAAGRGYPGDVTTPGGLAAGALGAGVGAASAAGGTRGGGAFGGGGATNIGFIGSFDPVAGFGWAWDRSETPLGITFITGVPALINQTTTYNSFFGQSFMTGTSYAVGLNGFRQSTNSQTNVFNPQVNASFFIGFNQPLLKGFGYRSNARFIRVAKNNLSAANEVFRQQVIETVSEVLNLYWDLIFFQENVEVAEQSLELARRTLRDNRIQVEIGILAPTEIVRAESEVAARKRDLIMAQTDLQQQENRIKNVISRTMDPDLAKARIEPTDTLHIPHEADIPELDDALNVAWRNRPEVEIDQIRLRNQRIALKSNRNALLPNLDIFASYSGAGLSGNRLIRPANDPFASPIRVKPGGVGQALTQVFHGSFPDYSFGVSLQIPIRNRTAQADYARALLDERQARLSAQQTRNTIEQEVRNALIELTQAKAQNQAAEKAAVLAEQTSDGEQKKYKLGRSTVFLVIQAQRDLDEARLNLNEARSTYAKALTELNRVMGTTLDKYSIQVSDAYTGKVTRMPNIPGSRDKS